jgi:glycine cleavage system aminomethyltransferase T
VGWIAQRYGCRMVVTATSEGQSRQLAALLRQAGAVFATHDGRSVAVNYGSAAGELAVCVTGVGLVDRSALAKLILQSPPTQLDQLLTRSVGGSVAPGGALSAGGAWWCSATEGQVFVLCEHETERGLRERLRTRALRHVALSISDCSDDWGAIELLGRKTGQVLQALGVYGESGDPRQTPPFTAHPLAGTRALWLLQSDRRALALVPSTLAGEVWLAIERIGCSFGLSCVGQEAADRYALLERAGRTSPAVA